MIGQKHGCHWQLMHLIATFSQHMEVPPLIFFPKGVKKDLKSGLINSLIEIHIQM